MWYALGHIQKPIPIIQVTQPVARKPRTIRVAPMPVQTIHTQTVYATHCPPVPGYLQKRVVIPRDDQVSEFAALHALARKMGLQFASAGPNYALYDTHIPLGRPVTALQFIQSVMNSYIPGVLFIWHGTLTVANLPPSYIKLNGAIPT